MKMRELINIINEASVANYPAGTLYLVSGGKTGQPLSKSLEAQGIRFDEPMTSVEWDKDLDVPNEIAATYGTNRPGKLATLFKDVDDQLWVFYGSTDGFFVHADKLANRGEIAEGILGAAMFAKFTKRAPSQEIAQVTPRDIDRVLNTLKKTGEDTYEVEVADADNQHADTVGFRLILNSTSAYKDLMDPDKRGALINEFESAAAYANTPNAERYSKYFYLNGKADNIRIVADGKSLQTESKVDVWVEANGQKLRLNTSLKVGGVKQFGQVGGSEQTSMVKLWNYFGVDVNQYIPKYEKLRTKDQFAALEYMYRSIADQLSAELAGDNNTEEAKFVLNITKAVEYFATLGEKNVKLVDFTKGGFKILRFSDLVQKMRGVNLTASYKENKGRPEIGIHDVAKPARELLSVRVKIENKKDGTQYVRNIIEKGPLLEELTLEKQGKWTGDAGSKVIPRATAPVAKPVAQAKPVPVAKPVVQPKVEPQATQQPEQDLTDYEYSAESVRPKRGISETKRQRR